MNKAPETRNFFVTWMQQFTALSVGTFFFLSAGAQAAPLSLTLNDTPDIVSSFIAVNYDAGTDVLTANGFALQLDDDGGPVETISSGLFALTAAINDAGELASGSLTISGTIPSLGFNSGTLLTGDLTAFGFLDAGGDPFEFLFDVTGGDAAALYGGGSITGGIILGFTGFSGDFTNNFGNNSAVADVATIPLPAAVWMFGSALLGLVGVGRHRTNS